MGSKLVTGPLTYLRRYWFTIEYLYIFNINIESKQKLLGLFEAVSNALAPPPCMQSGAIGHEQYSFE